MKTEKVCTKCKTAKPLEAFSSESRAKDGRRSRCRICMAAANAAYYAANKDKPEFKESKAAAYAAWIKANPERKAATDAAWYETNKQRIAVTSAAWAKDNPEKCRAAKAKRRAAKLKRTPAWADLDAIAAIYAACTEGLEVDHIIPLQGRNVSGFHVAENLQYLTKSENASKGNRFRSKDHRYAHPALAKILRLRG